MLILPERWIKEPDENGGTFELSSMLHMYFRDAIEPWYLETSSIVVKGIDDIHEIGCYVRMKDL